MHLKLFVIFLTAILLSACVEEDQPKNIGVEGGDMLPSFSIVLNTGEHLSDISLRGKVAVIEFFNTSCGDCREFFPLYQNLYDEFKENPEVEIFSIARDEQESSIINYWIENNLTIPFSPQPDRQIYNLFATVGIPRVYIADKKGIIRYVLTDADHPTLSQLRADIQTLLE
ncbi:MAG: TlpA family protein disulfide reductase [Muribaculaceae bacterium]|nr:TlpA family protein disulfide reductase [Muribaculaceae bacterium]